MNYVSRGPAIKWPIGNILEIGQWLLDQKLVEAGRSPDGYGIAIDGKTLRRIHNSTKKGFIF